MKELKLKDIAGYASHCLKGEFQGAVDVLTAIDYENGIVSSMNNGSFLVKDFKPYLHKTSIFAGKRTGGEVMEVLKCQITCVHEIWNYGSILNRSSVSSGTISVMERNHIDFNNLIPKGLAIDINILKE